MLASSYRPVEYWLEQGRTYREDFESWNKDPVRRANYQAQMRFLLGVLRPVRFNSVLEIGCGFGRVTKLMVETFRDLEAYDALDLSPDQIAAAQRLVDSEKVTYYCSTFQEFNPKGEKRYDLVLASEVLLHVLPSEVESFLTKMVTLSKVHVVHIDWHPKEVPREIAPHNFAHDYEGIYKKLGSRIRSLDVIQIKGRRFSLFPVSAQQAIFHATISTT